MKNGRIVSGEWRMDSIRYSQFATRRSRNERRKQTAAGGCCVFVLASQEINVGSETPTDANRILPGLTGPAAPGAPGAHLSAFHHGSRPKESFIARDSASGQASWDVAGHVLRIL